MRERTALAAVAVREPRLGSLVEAARSLPARRAPAEPDEAPQAEPPQAPAPDEPPAQRARRPMMRGMATLLSAVVVVFSLTFVGARLSAAPAPAAAPSLAAAPTGAGPPLAVRTLRGVAPLPRPQLAMGAPAGVPSAPPSPPPRAAGLVAEATARRAALCACSVLMPCGGAPAPPRTGRC